MIYDRDLWHKFFHSGSQELAKERVSEAHGQQPSSASSSSEEVFTKIQELPKALSALLGNPAFFMLNLAGASEGLLIAGFAAFLPKLIENQFSVTASSAALLMGAYTTDWEQYMRRYRFCTVKILLHPQDWWPSQPEAEVLSSVATSSSTGTFSAPAYWNSA